MEQLHQDFQTRLPSNRNSILASLYPSVCLSACIMYWYWELLRKSVKYIQISLQLDTNIGHLTWKSKYGFYCWLHKFARKAPLCRITFLYRYSDMQLNNTHRMYYCVSTATQVKQNRHNVMLCVHCLLIYTGHFIMFSVITNSYNKKTKGPTLMKFFTATGRLKRLFFDN